MLVIFYKIKNDQIAIVVLSNLLGFHSDSWCETFEKIVFLTGLISSNFVSETLKCNEFRFQTVLLLR